MAAPAGLYIHVPFCRARCPFCDFAITTELDGIGAWAGALEAEMELRAPAWRVRFDTVYLGGGPPSAVPTEVLAGGPRQARQAFHGTPDGQGPLEASPG